MNNTLLTKSVLATAITLSVAACSPSGGGLAGIGGSGYISSGSITGFGSVYVNGVKFETNSAIFDVDGDSGTQADLAIGMIVKVDGSINADGATGTATSISFDEELQGPVSAVGLPDADGVKRISVLGISVVVDSNSTIFDLDGDLDASTVFDFDNIKMRNNIEISGFFDTSGDLRATRLELKDVDFNTTSIVEVEGTIKDLSGTTFNLGSLTVNASAATLDDLSSLEDNILVEVKGTLSGDLKTIIASKVEAEDDSVEDTDEFEIEGIITDYIDNSNFKIGGITVNASSAKLEPVFSLHDDLHIEAEGTIVNGILIATDIELEGGNIKVHAEVTGVDSFANTFEVTPVSGSGQTITVTISTLTQLEDDVSGIESFTLDSLNPGDFVEVSGVENIAGGISALEVDVKEVSDTLLQGFAAAEAGSTASSGTITILGVSFDFDGTTEFENKNDDDLKPAELDALIADILTTPQLLKIKDKELGPDGNSVGIADEIDIE